ncbi:leucine-rich repeat-containing protein 47-like [Ceratina calcarata]|uniref:Leucine-rich repeat-containing protein 47-like n=1 Tax=Ceratina calcarata TaxID=156304 RepID=A0AAJ7JDI3_9HYME|nr:leucine-rich repeat-containing protein 47-like [Ceratina calcarata]XP_026674675.1 leucine-rich repeat-containing protein 47-like [Ceratina calcarata]
MTIDDSWHVIKAAAAENKHELVLSGSAISELIQKRGLDKSLFNLQHLNYLNITQTCLHEVPEEIGQLVNLATLVLHSNDISKIPGTIVKLEKLKVLDCSRNKLSSLPDEISKLPQLTTMNLSSNLLRSLPTQMSNVKLSVLDLSNNQFEEFPDVCYPELIHLSEIYANGNKIKAIPTTISQLASLKILNVADNSITAVPGEIADCNKLKDLDLKGNALTDKRLSKLVDQCRTKQIMEYVKLHCAKQDGSVSANSKSKKGKKAQRLSESENNANSIEALTHKLKVLKVTNETPVIKITKHVKNIRPYIAACIVRNMKFTEDSFKKFIQFQTRLHDGICEKRNAATIATHDLKLIAPGDLTYTAMPPNELEIKPLMHNKVYTGVALFQRLQAEAENLRKEKKRNVYSGIHKYLYLLEGKPLFPCLLDATEQVISFPPITNSDITKMSADSQEMLIEVTSATSYQICRNVLDQFLKELVVLGFASVSQEENSSNYHNLVVEQVKVVDMEGNMKLLYPSRADLDYAENLIAVLRE